VTRWWGAASVVVSWRATLEEKEVERRPEVVTMVTRGQTRGDGAGSCLRMTLFRMRCTCYHPRHMRHGHVLIEKVGPRAWPGLP
jgi:hypothetical protein